MRKWLPYVAGCTLLASAACGADDKETGEGDDQQPEMIALSLMHSYHAGGGEEEALRQLVKNYTDAHPNVKVEIIAQVYEDVFNIWTEEVTSGKSTPQLFVAPNDNLGDLVRKGLIADITDDLANRLDGVAELGVDGMRYEGQVYGVPLNLKAIGLCYNKSTLPVPPATMEELNAALTTGGKKIAIPVGAYHLFPFLTVAGGELFNEDGTCITNGDQAADEVRAAAASVFELLHSPGAMLYTNTEESPYAMASAVFGSGEADMYICGPWELKDLEGVLEGDLGVAKFPQGARPLVGVDGWYVNANVEGAEKAAAVELALALTDKSAQGLYAETAGNPPARTDVTTEDPLVGLFSQVANEGFSRPQTPAFGQYWGPFGEAFLEIMAAEDLAGAQAAADKACHAMNVAIAGQ